MKQNLRSVLHPMVAGLNVLVVYENLRQGIQAIGLCDRLAEKLAPEVELQTGFWSLDALELPDLARAARQEADQTDVLIVAVESDAPLPPPFQGWLRRWARRQRSHQGVLAARIHGLLSKGCGYSPAFACLQQMATDAGVDFLWEAVESAGGRTVGCRGALTAGGRF